MQCTGGEGGEMEGVLTWLDAGNHRGTGANELDNLTAVLQIQSSDSNLQWAQAITDARGADSKVGKKGPDGLAIVSPNDEMSRTICKPTARTVRAQD